MPGPGPTELSFAGPMELTGSGVQACMNGELCGRVAVQCSAIFTMPCSTAVVECCWAAAGWHHRSATAVVLGLTGGLVVHKSGGRRLTCHVGRVLKCSIAIPSPSSSLIVLHHLLPAIGLVTSAVLPNSRVALVVSTLQPPRLPDSSLSAR